MYFFQIVISAVSILAWSAAIGMSFQIRYPSSVTYMTGGGFFPFLISAILIVLNVVWMVDSIQCLRAGKSASVTTEQKPTLLSHLFGTKEQSKRLLQIMLLTVCYIFALIPLSAIINRTYGFLVSTFIFLMISIRLFGKAKWSKTFVISALTSIIVFVAMYHVLGLPMPK